jgi:hypothetical protein
MEDPEDFSSPGMKRSMCSFCGKKWPESIDSPSDSILRNELMLRRWKDGEATTADMITTLMESIDARWWKSTELIRRNLQKRKKPMYVRKPGMIDFQLATPTTESERV